MSGLIGEFFNTPIPEKVWHYTSISALEGILSSGAVWATEVHYTTDASEFVHAQNVATAFLQEIVPADESMARAKQAGLNVLVHAFENGPLSPDITEVFVASFSSCADLKSQWMEYADAGRGVSIAFDLSGIRPPQELGYALAFAPCVYIQDEKEKLLAAALGHFMQTFAELDRNTRSHRWAAERLRDWLLVDQIYGLEFNRAVFDAANDEYIRALLHGALTQTSFDLLRLASHCKDYAFHQQAEWRLSLPHTKSKPFRGIEVQYRGAEQHIPYLAHNLFSERLPITEVLVGPFCQDLATIEQLLDTYNCRVPVVMSGIPIRNPNKIR